jgi:hypothetical protein
VAGPNQIFVAFGAGVAIEALLILGDAVLDPRYLLHMALGVPLAIAYGRGRGGPLLGIVLGICAAICFTGVAIFRKPGYQVTERGAVCRTLTFWFAVAPLIRSAHGDALTPILLGLTASAVMTAIVIAPLLRRRLWRRLKRPIFFWNGIASWITALACNWAFVGTALGVSDAPMIFPLAQAVFGGIGFMCAAADGFALFGMETSDHPTQEEIAEHKRRFNEVTHEYGPGARTVLGIAVVQAAVLSANSYARMVPQSIVLNLSLAALPLLLRQMAESGGGVERPKGNMISSSRHLHPGGHRP